MNLELIPQYELIQHEYICDIASDGYLLKHKKSGARILVLQNDDENKVFNIAFRTTPTDSTGVAHILEHSVLCGSRRFPSKDPFVELVKGSMNTFLNAMTFPDKTMYPVASCNDKDFNNLMHVYLDAVFYPNIYQKEEIFRQEGWSCQLESPEDEVIYNGVVYNEMKGAFSSPEDVLEREIMNSLFPDTTYGVESGGDPNCIPNLTYGEFLAFHTRYYHPSNSYIYFYGDMNAEERLNWLDQEYLSAFDLQEFNSEIGLQQPFDQMREIYHTYPISENDELKDNTYLAYNTVVGTSLDGELSNAFAVLEYALLDAPGAPLKQALLDAGIGKDILSSYESGIYQPCFSVIAKNANKADKERFLAIIRETLEQIVSEGIDKKAFLAGINIMEFKFREADYGSYPKGLIYGIDLFDSWLYDENAPFTYLKQLDVYAALKERVTTSYFENLISEYLIDNNHATLIVLEPEQGLATKKEEAVREKLQKYKDSLSEDQILELIKKTEKLRAFQEMPSAPEELARIPRLGREDIGKTAPGFQNTEYQWQGTRILHHDVFSNGIAYLDILFDITRLTREEIPYLGILKSVLSMVDTDNYTYQALNSEINCNTGGISMGVSVYPLPEEEGGLLAFAGVRVRVLYDKLDYAYKMAEEILLHSRIEDDKRLYEILAKAKSRLSMHLTSAGHSTAASRALSYFSTYNAFNEAIGGIDFYRLIEDLEKNFEEKKETLKAVLKRMIRKLYCKEGLMISLTCDKEGLEWMKKPFEAFLYALPKAEYPVQNNTLPLLVKNEGFMTQGQVQYVARAGSYLKSGYRYTGVLRILKILLGYDYLWTNVRVRGGAYGCMSSFGRMGDVCFVSYRDPHLKKTMEVYERIPEYLEQFEADEDEMTKHIIGTVSELDTPLTPSAKGRRSLNAYFTGITQEQLQQERDEILQATAEQIRALAPLVRSVLDTNAICVIGNEDKLRKEKEMFASVEMLTN